MTTPKVTNAPNNPTKEGPDVTKKEEKEIEKREGDPSRKRPVTEIFINNKSIVKLEVPDTVDVKKEWQEYLKANEKGSKDDLPTAFIGKLVNEKKCIQVRADEQADSTVKLKS